MVVRACSTALPLLTSFSPPPLTACAQNSPQRMGRSYKLPPMYGERARCRQRENTDQKSSHKTRCTTQNDHTRKPSEQVSLIGRSSAARCSNESRAVLQLSSRTADMLDLHLLSEACMLVCWLCNVALPAFPQTSCLRPLTPTWPGCRTVRIVHVAHGIPEPRARRSRFCVFRDCADRRIVHARSCGTETQCFHRHIAEWLLRG